MYLFIRDTEREAETQAEGEAGSTQGARHETRSRVSRITPWAEGGAKSLSHPGCPHLYVDDSLVIWLSEVYWLKIVLSHRIFCDNGNILYLHY